MLSTWVCSTEAHRGISFGIGPHGHVVQFRFRCKVARRGKAPYGWAARAEWSLVEYVLGPGYATLYPPKLS